MTSKLETKLKEYAAYMEKDVAGIFLEESEEGTQVTVELRSSYCASELLLNINAIRLLIRQTVSNDCLVSIRLKTSLGEVEEPVS